MIHKLIVSILFSSLFLLSFSVNAQDDKEYEKKIREVLTFVRDSIFKEKDTLMTANYLSNGRRFYSCTICLDKQFEKIDLFSIDEIASVYKEMRDTSKYWLIPGMIEQIRLVSEGQKYLHSIIHLSRPIYLRNNSYCIVGYTTPYETEYEPGGWDERYTIVLLKKQDIKWVFLKKIAWGGGLD